MFKSDKKRIKNKKRRSLQINFSLTVPAGRLRLSLVMDRRQHLATAVVFLILVAKPTLTKFLLNLGSSFV